MKPITVAYQNERFSKHITYTFDLILSILGIEYEIYPYPEIADSIDSQLLISYGHKKIESNAKYQIHIYESKLFGETYRTAPSMPKLPLKRWNDLPVIYEGQSDLRAFVVHSDNMVETNIDLIASSFFMVSRYEEIIVDEKDQYNRFPATASVAYKENFLTCPIVNEYIDVVWQWIDRFGLGLDRRVFWAGKDFAVLLTHDVDEIQKIRLRRPPLKTIASLAKYGQVSKASRYAWDWAASVWDWAASSLLNIKPDPYWTFDYITNLEHKYGLTSSFYFMTNGNTEYDNSYSVNASKVVNLIRKLEDQGHEVGLHGSFNSYNDLEFFASEKAKLDQFVSNKHYGGRQHYLRWRTPYTWRIWEESGMLYDATLGYADHEGFRCSICLPYKPFDVLENRVLDIWELPLTVMDATLYGYRNLSKEEAWKSIRLLLEVVSKHHGMFVLLWHNSSLDELDLPDWKRLYERMMDYIGSKVVFGGSGREIMARLDLKRSQKI